MLTLEKLQQMNPEDLEVTNPPNTPYWSARVEYLLMYQPNLLKRLFLNNRTELYRMIEREVQKALITQMILERQGRSEIEAIEAAIEQIAPNEGQPKRPLSQNLDWKIRNWAMAPLID